MDHDTKHIGEEVYPTKSHSQGDVEELKGAGLHDAVFGEISEDGPNYKDVGWMGTVVIMMKTQIGLGVLGIPSVLHSLGLVPGVLILLIVATMTTWSGKRKDTTSVR